MVLLRTPPPLRLRFVVHCLFSSSSFSSSHSFAALRSRSSPLSRLFIRPRYLIPFPILLLLLLFLLFFSFVRGSGCSKVLSFCGFWVGFGASGPRGLEWEWGLSCPRPSPPRPYRRSRPPHKHTVLSRFRYIRGLWWTMLLCYCCLFGSIHWATYPITGAVTGSSYFNCIVFVTNFIISH